MVKVDENVIHKIEDLSVNKQNLYFLMRVWKFIRDWPILPGVVMGLLVISAIFAPFIAPSDPRTQ